MLFANTAILQQGVTERYVLAATDAHATIPSGSSFRGLVFNSLTGDLASQSQPVQVEPFHPPISNPHFKWWTLDGETGRQVPFGWHLLMSDPSPYSGIEELDDTKPGGLQMKLNHTSPEGKIGMISLVQRIPLDAATFRVLTLRSPSDQSAVSGAAFADGVHTLYYLYSPTATSRTVNVHAENTTITVPAGPAGWTWIAIGASSEWSLQGWSTPRTLQFSLFLKATSNGVFYAPIEQID